MNPFFALIFRPSPLLAVVAVAVVAALALTALAMAALALAVLVLPLAGGEGPAQGLDPVPDLCYGQVLDLLRGDGGVQVVEGQVSPVLAQGEAGLVGLVMLLATGGEAVGVFLAGGTVLGLGEQVLALGLVLAADGDGEGAVLGQQGGDRVAGQDGLQGGRTV